MAARSPWKNHYFALRHGEVSRCVFCTCMCDLNTIFTNSGHLQSEANVQGLIVSHPDNGIEKFGLTQQGKQQSAKVILISAVSIKQFLLDCVQVFYLFSPFVHSWPELFFYRKRLGFRPCVDLVNYATSWSIFSTLSPIPPVMCNIQIIIHLAFIPHGLICHTRRTLSMIVTNWSMFINTTQWIR